MPRRLLPAGLGAQLALAIVALTSLAVGLSFVAMYRGTGARLRERVDSDLRTQVAEWDQLAARADLSTPESVEHTARRYIASQSYHPASRVFMIDVADGRPVTNHPRILEHELERERTEERGTPEPGETHSDEVEEVASGLLDAPPGLSTASIEEAGRMRVLTLPIDHGGRRIGTLRVADPLKPIEDAQSSLLRTFTLVGSLVLLLAVAGGVWLGRLITRPLRRMAHVAAAVDAGDLSLRAGSLGSRGEVGVLAMAFDRMLERLEDAFARQRDFVSDASHELRTPLSVLRAQVELLDRETDVDRRHKATVTLLRRLDEMDRLVADMLTLAGAESGRLIDTRAIDLDDYFEDLSRDLPLFGDRDFRVEAVGGVLEADPDRLTQVLRNLVRNAVAHTGASDRITVAARARGGTLEIAVTDTGPGIAPEHREAIFERFYRTDHSRSRGTGGSGLGLAIARAIVEAHGGRIRAESPPGDGASIMVELPGYRPGSRAGGDS